MNETLDIEKLLAPVSADNPCGPDLEDANDPAYVEFMDLTKGKEEEHVDTFTDSSGRENKSVNMVRVDPNWTEILSKASALLNRSKQIKIMLWVTVAALQKHGFAGLRDGLTLIKNALERYWDTIHPEPSDREILVMRLRELSPDNPEEGDLRLLPRLRDTVLLTNGPVSMRLYDYLTASGMLKMKEGEKAAFADATTAKSFISQAHPTQMADRLAEVIACSDALDDIARIVTEKMPSDTLVLTGIKKLIGYARKALEGGAPAAAEASAANAAAPGATYAVTPGGSPAASGDITTPAAVIAALDRIIDYYDRSEPSSPVPMILSRAKRLVGKKFSEAILDLAPDAIKDLERIVGERLTPEEIPPPQ